RRNSAIDGAASEVKAEKALVRRRELLARGPSSRLPTRMRPGLTWGRKFIMSPCPKGGLKCWFAALALTLPSGCSTPARAKSSIARQRLCAWRPQKPAKNLGSRLAVLCVRFFQAASPVLSPSLATPEPLEQKKHGNQRKHKKYRSALPVNDAMDHLRTNM